MKTTLSGARPVLYFYDAAGKAETYRIDGVGRLTMLEHREDLALTRIRE